MRLAIPSFLACGALVLTLGASARAQDFSAADVQFFETKVRPVLADRCLSCHSAAKKVKGELHLDTRAGVLRGGERGPVLELGSPEKSRLIDAIRYMNPDLQMPPKGKLSDDQIAALEKWVKLGAPWPKEAEPAGGGGAEAPAAFDVQKRKAAHWAWQPIRAVPPPAVTNSAWVADPIDQYVLAKLEAKQLTPAAPADRRALIRRAYFDIVGLPPTPEAVETFVNDASPDAFAKVVDDLLASPHYGERWGRHWLDLVRYAETYGHEFDYPIPHASEYLYYVIRAFNADVPYDRFAMEHIAGDLLPEPRLHPTEGYNESPIGTGFWYFHEQTHAPVDVRQHQADRVDNQVDVFGKTFQGLTIACARCHDHKFDAISTRDYYALYGVLESTRQQQAFLDPHGKVASHVALIDQARREGDALVAAAAQPVARTTPEYPATATRFEGFDAPTFDGWFPTGFAFGAGPAGEAQWDSVRRDPPRLARPGVAHSGLLAGKLRGTLRSRSFVIDKPYVDFLLAGNGGRVRFLVDTYTMDEFSALLFEGLTFDVKTENGRFQWHRIDASRYLGHRAHIELIDEGDTYVAVDEVVFTDGSGGLAAPPDEQPVLTALAGSPELTAVAAMMDELAGTLPEPVRVLAAHDGEGVDERVFRRGSYKVLGDVVPRHFLEALDGNGAGPLAAPGAGSGRLELARRVASPDNPLTARVMANRVWHHLFSRGIVPSVDDFGVMGQPPSHPELLDHLADRFVRDGWSVKRLIRSIVLSNTYRMSSAASEHATRVDPQNGLLHHMPVRRLQGEAVRDAILAVSGRLDRTPYAPIVDVHLTDFMEGRGRPTTGGGPLDGDGRRSVYTKVRRNFLPPMMLAFDMPIPFNAIGRRSVSNVPAQALILMNDPFVIEQAKVWATRVLGEPGLTPERRIDRMYREAFSRPPTPQETADALEFMKAQAAQLGASADDVSVWTDFAHVLFNVKEFVFVN
jgi:hypothetical protein